MKIKECKKCGYLWEARIKNPKSCPRCKQRMDTKVAKPKEVGK